MKKRVLLLIMCVFAYAAVSAQATSIAVVGAGVGGWPGDPGNPGPVDVHQMTKVDADNWILTDLVVIGNGIKFRANNNWDDATATPISGFNIGAPASGPQWPSAIGTNAGSSNDIKVGVIPGTYTVKLNTATLAYSFEGGAPIPVVKLVGSAVDGGSIQMIGSDADNFSVQVTLLAGTAKFEVDGALISDSAFPSGVAFDGGSAVGPITAGEWVVKINVATGEYSFTAPPAAIWAMTGSAIKGFGTGYDWGTDLIFNSTDGVNYSYSGIDIAEGGFKFREAGLWSTAKGCDASDDNQPGFFPTGAPGGKNINVAADQVGNYDATFNRITGAYLFTKNLSTKGFSSSNFKVYPNPTQNVWNFTSANEKIESIKIVDVLGKTVLSVAPKNNVTNVDASSLNTGIYFAKIATAKATETIKLMKN